METAGGERRGRDRELGRVLERALDPVALPLGFMGSVWRRVRGDVEEVGWRELLGWLFRPGWVVVTLGGLLVAGMWHGIREGQEDRRMAAERRYVISVEPEASPF